MTDENNILNAALHSDGQGTEQIVQVPQSETMHLNMPEEDSQATGPERPSFLLDKYLTNDRSIEEATNEQAKAYVDLQKKFGGFTGAPDTYDTSFTESIGFTLDQNNENLKAFNEYAKASNMSQEMYQATIEVYAKDKIGDKPQSAEDFISSLEPVEKNQLVNFSKWATSNLDDTQLQAFNKIASDKENFPVLQAFMDMSQSNIVPSMKDIDSPPEREEVNEGYIQDLLYDKRYEKDEIFTARANKIIENYALNRKR